MARGHVPERTGRVVIMREPQLARLAVVVAADQRQTAVARAEGVLDDGAKDLGRRPESPVPAGRRRSAGACASRLGWAGSEIAAAGRSRLPSSERAKEGPGMP